MDGGAAAGHAWHVDEHETRRHEERRGRRHVFTRLDPRHTALVVVDLVPFFARENPYCRGIVPNVDRLAATTRRTGGVVAWVLPGDPGPSPAYDELLGPAVAATYRASGGSGPLRERLWPELTTGPDDLYVEKTAASAFFPGRCDLDRLLRERGVDTVVVTGTVTNVCVESTVRDASTLGYRVVLVADACAAVDDRTHNATLHTVYRSFGDVRPTDEVEALLAAGAADPDVARSQA
jgi:nicotinamidase-related amidase